MKFISLIWLHNVDYPLPLILWVRELEESVDKLLIGVHGCGITNLTFFVGHSLQTSIKKLPVYSQTLLNHGYV